MSQRECMKRYYEKNKERIIQMRKEYQKKKNEQKNLHTDKSN